MEGAAGWAGGGELQLAADVATRVDAVAQRQDVEDDERGHEGDQSEHAYMIGHMFWYL